MVSSTLVGLTGDDARDEVRHDVFQAEAFLVAAKAAT